MSILLDNNVLDGSPTDTGETSALFKEKIDRLLAKLQWRAA